MIDKRGYTPDDDEFYELNHDTWILQGEHDGQCLYQKVADGNPIPLVKATKNRCGAPDFRRWCELDTGLTWAEIAAKYEVMKA